MATAPIFIIGGYGALTKPGGRVQMAAPTLEKIREYVPVLPDDDELLVRINGGIQLAAGTTWRCQGVEATWGSPASSRANASVGVR